MPLNNLRQLPQEVLNDSGVDADYQALKFLQHFVGVDGLQMRNELPKVIYGVCEFTPLQPPGRPACDRRYPAEQLQRGDQSHDPDEVDFK